LIERRVFRARGRARIGPPFGAHGGALREEAHAGRSQQGQTSRERDKPADDNCSTLHRCPLSWRLTGIQRPSLCFDTDIAAANRTALHLKSDVACSTLHEREPNLLGMAVPVESGTATIPAATRLRSRSPTFNC